MIVISPLKETLNEKLKESSELVMINPNDKSAQKYLEAIHALIAVCENRNRF